MNQSVTKPAAKEELKKPAEKIQQKKRGKGKTPKEIVKKHVADKNDVITEEDFRNVIVGENLPDDTAQTPLDIPDDNERPKDEDKDPKVVTPWDVIS